LSAAAAGADATAAAAAAAAGLGRTQQATFNVEPTETSRQHVLLQNGYWWRKGSKSPHH